MDGGSVDQGGAGSSWGCGTVDRWMARGTQNWKARMRAQEQDEVAIDIKGLDGELQGPVEIFLRCMLRQGKEDAQGKACGGLSDRRQQAVPGKD